ncbi:MAG: TldD/PmbA family protein [Myxococcales bacterium]|nr:TldD/PmbA family protein [Myxococcales bacterium]
MSLRAANDEGARRLPDPQACQRAAEQMLGYALKAGAEGAEVLVRDGAELEVRLRLGEPELIKEAGSRALGLRVLKDGRPAVTYTSDFSDAGLERLARETVELAALAEPDVFAALPAPELMARQVPDLALWDDEVPRLTVEDAIAWTTRGEAAARAFDPRITNSDGASLSRVVGATAFASSAGFSGGYRGSYVSLVVQPIADDEGGKKRNGSWWTGGRFVASLESPESVGETAARRTLAQLGAQKVATCQVPVIFPPEAGRSLLGKLAGVTSGGAVWRRSSYLADREGTEVASSLVNIADDPLIPGAPGSRPFDGEGLASRVNVLVDGGILRTFLCDTYAARKLNRVSTGSAGRGVGGGPHVSTSNLIMRPGGTPRETIERVPEGFYVTHLMGFGFSGVTGDFSQGASGFWVKNGERTMPVSEVTISANFDDLWKNVDAVADDLDTRSSTQVPTFRVSHMTVAGR